jgi:phosphoribosylglycinamide formyltransferase-1
MKQRVVVLISGAGSNMLALAQACDDGSVQGELVGIFADRPCEGIEAAEKRGIPAAVLSPGDHASRDAWSAALRDAVAVREPALVVSAGFMRILAPVFVDTFATRLINLHPSLLPSFPGAHAVRDALAAGVKVSGSTVHFVDHLVDHGPILLQRAVEVDPSDDEASLHAKIKTAEHEMLPEACRLVLEGRVEVTDGVVRMRR